MSQIYQLYRIHIDHIKTECETYLMEGVSAPLLPFAFGVTSVKKNVQINHSVNNQSIHNNNQ